MSTENNSPYVLWLPSWYPCKLTPYDGDFIQRHARATALNCFVHVVHIIRDKEGIITKETKIEESENGNLRETIIYYYIKPTSINKLDGFFSYRKFSKLYKSFLNEYFLKHGLPSLVHVHISFKAGIIARWIRINIGIPYLLTEQWTVYLEEARPRHVSE